jgi:hypothetical protein
MKAVFDSTGKFKSLVSLPVSSGHTTISPVFSSDEIVIEVGEDVAVLIKETPDKIKLSKDKKSIDMVK